jgi:hypothetical protein
VTVREAPPGSAEVVACAVPPGQSAALPVCSTELLPSPSSPVQDDAYEVVLVRVTDGCTQLAETPVNWAPVAA